MSEEIKLTEKGVQNFLNSKDGFQGEAFFSNLIFPIFGEERFHPSGKEMLEAEPVLRTEAKKVGIKSIIHHGDIDVKFGSLYVFEIVVADRVALVRNRVAVQGVVRRLMKSYTGAFMIFHYANTANWDWRFSFCCRRDGKEQTEAKRYTFLLGPNQACRTAAQNFVKLAERVRDRSATLDDLVSAFDVEALSREFFRKYTDHYSAFVKYVTGKSFKKVGGVWKEVDEGTSNAKMYADFGHDDKRVRDYVKKLLGRVVFLHFLQKKGWLGGRKGWTDGQPDFMWQLYSQAGKKQDDFLDAVLEPLFSAIDEKRKDDFYDTGVAAIGRIKIPYLNGGLFTRDALDRIPTKFPKKYFEELLAFLSEYNFTIDENDPNDAEVGVDPEMLGRIFENLLEDNRDKGAYYTPKAIVEYMCRRSLAAYLAVGCDAALAKKIEGFVNDHDAAKLTKDAAEKLLRKLKSVKVCDPAIGSGAFPMGLLREIRLCRETLEDRLELPEAKRTPPAALTKEIIENNIYGVDIERGAVDIARLRFWLALVVDEETPQALPNLDFKIMQGNSLLESYRGIDLSSILPDAKGVARAAAHLVQSEFRGLAPKRIVQGELAFGGETASAVITERMREYYRTADRRTKQDLIADISEQVRGYLMASGLQKKWHAELVDLGLQNDRFFLWHTWFADVFANGGFDIVIGNPPYVKEYTCRKAFDGFRDVSPYYIGKMDLWYGFACHGIDMLAPNGILCFIAQNNWTTSAGAKLMREKVIRDSRILELMDFNDYMVFGEDNPDGPQIQTMIMSFVRDSATNPYKFEDWTLTAGASRLDMRQMLQHVSANSVKLITPTIKREEKKGLLTFTENDGIFEKIVEGKTYLLDNEVAQGIVPNPDVVNNRNRKLLTDQTIKTGEGVFVVPVGYFSSVGEGEKKYIRPLYEPYQMERYCFEAKVEKQILYITKQNWHNDAPLLVAHLKKYKEIMEERRENKNGRISFMHLHWPREEKFFVPGEKILSVRKCVDGPVFAYTRKAAYVMMSVNVIQTFRWNMKFLTGVLNSALVTYWLRHRGKMQGENFQIDKEPLLGIPLPKPELVDQKPIMGLVDQILSAKSANPSADTSSLEAEIDSLVFDLYGLTAEERAIVLGQGNPNAEG